MHAYLDQMKKDEKSALERNAYQAAALPVKPQREDGFYDHHGEVLAEQKRFQEMELTQMKFLEAEWEDIGDSTSDYSSIPQPQDEDPSPSSSSSGFEKGAQYFKDLKSKFSKMF